MITREQAMGMSLGDKVLAWRPGRGGNRLAESTPVDFQWGVYLNTHEIPNRDGVDTEHRIGLAFCDGDVKFFTPEDVFLSFNEAADFVASDVESFHVEQNGRDAAWQAFLMEKA